MRIPGTALALPTPPIIRRADRELATVEQPVRRHAATAILPVASVAGKDSAHPFTDLVMGGIDINPELSGSAKYLIYEEMRKSDPACKSSLWLYKLPIRQADWTLDAFSDAPEDLLIQDATAWQFGLNGQDGQLDLSWDEWLQQSLLAFDFGAMFEETMWGDPVIWTPTGGGDSRLMRPVARFAPRFPVTIREIDHDPQTGRIARMRQLIANTDWIPGDQLLWYVLEKEGADWFGTSLLRAMYGPWRLKKALMVSSGIAWDRFGSGTPIVRYPTGGGPQAKREAEQMGRNYRTHERSYLVFEGPPEKGWDFKIADGSQAMSDPTPLLHWYDEQIATAGLQQFSVLGKTATGARAVGEVLVDPFYQAVGAMAEYFRAQRQRLAIRRFVDMNFGPEYATPLLRVGKIQQKNVLMLAQAIEALSAAGLSFTDRGTQNDVRDLLDLQRLSETAQDALDDLPDDVGLELAPGEGDPVAA